MPAPPMNQPRRFNTAGPCIPGVHYMIPPERRLMEARTLVEQGLFFILHAPRQTGKTTLLNTLARVLEQEGRFTAMVASVEYLRRTTDPREGNLSLIQHLRATAIRAQIPVAEQLPDPTPFMADPPTALHSYLSAWAESCPKPVVLFLDEIDSLPEDLLLSVLAQLRMGYTARPAPFLHSLALVGLRDVRDFRVKLRPDTESMGTSSPFNVKSDSLTLSNFTRADIAELYGQHTSDTGQLFTPEAVDRAWEATGGQPWLVNALGRQIIEKDAPDRAQAITGAHVEAAKETIIQRRDTHLDSLVDKLREDRVRRIIEPILAGTTMDMDTYNDDLVYVRNLGLVETKPSIRIANAIYQEIIPRSLTWVMQVNITHEATWYTRPDGSLDVRALLRAFQEFFAEHSDAWLGRFDYKEAGPQLVLMAFLQRVVNGGGAIRREFAVGSGRVDLLVEWRGQREAIELKIRRSDRTETQGIAQLSGYLARLGLDEGYLLIFDRRPEVSWEAKLFERESVGTGGQKIHVLGA